MSSKVNRRSVPAAVLAALALAVLPVTQATAFDLRSPDARDAAITAEKADKVDLRSPDARDAGRVVVGRPPLTASHHDGHGINWGTIGIGGGGALALALAALGAAVAVRSRYHRPLGTN